MKRLDFLIVLYSFFFISSCMTANNVVVRDRIAEMEVNAIVKHFKKDVKSLKFGPAKRKFVKARLVGRMVCTKTHAIGCARSKGDLFIIHLDFETWLTLDYKEKMILVYHEMLHGMYQIDHKEGTLMDPYFKKGKTVVLSRTEHRFLDKLKGALNDFKNETIR